MKKLERYFWWCLAMLTCGAVATMVYEVMAIQWGGGILGQFFGIVAYTWVFYELKTGKMWGNDKLTENVY